MLKLICSWQHINGLSSILSSGKHILVKTSSVLLVSIFLVTATGCGGGEGVIETSGGDIVGSDIVGGGDIGGGGGYTGVATLTWTPPTTRVDGSSLTDLAGYRIYYGTSEGNYTESIEISNTGITEYVIDSLPPNTYYFVITAFDSSGNESSYSNEGSKSISG